MAIVGYARALSPDDDVMGIQIDALRTAGCIEIFKDFGSAASPRRQGLLAALEYLEKGDILVIWRLDRLERSLSHVIGLVNDLHSRAVRIRSLTESIDTAGANGGAAVNLFAALARFERDQVRERTHAGRTAAIAGRSGGRRTVVTPRKLERAVALIANGLTVREAAARIRVGKTALYEALKARKTKSAIEFESAY